jgi:hypothetical protein
LRERRCGSSRTLYTLYNLDPWPLILALTAESIKFDPCAIMGA